jgi:hypothetical protein
MVFDGEPDIKLGDSNRTFYSRYSLGCGTPGGWIYNYVTTTSVNNSRAGRPNSFDQVGLEEMFAEIAKGKVIPVTLGLVSEGWR